MKRSLCPRLVYQQHAQRLKNTDLVHRLAPSMGETTSM